jgi:hypothetical protein
MIGSSQVRPLVRTLTKGKNEIEFNYLVGTVYGKPSSELRPIHRAIVEAELDENGFRRRPGGSTIFVR